MKQIIIGLFIMLLMACNQQPVQVTVKMDTPRDTVYVEKIIYKDSRTIAKGMGSAELDKALGIVDTSTHTTKSGVKWRRIDRSKSVELKDTTYSYICKYNNGWKCNKLRIATEKDFFDNDPLDIRR